MNIFIYNNNKSLENVIFNNFESNPGIGGTEFVSLQLACELSNLNPQLNVNFVTERIFLVNKTNRIKFIKSINTESDIDIHIIPRSQFDFFLQNNVKNGRLIVWSHHPHDRLSEIKRKFNNKYSISFVSIGIYQYLSNKLSIGPHYLIKNLSTDLFPVIKKNVIYNSINFVFLGGLNPAKGFHRILKMWPNICTMLPGSRLNVIGGDLYKEEVLTSTNNIPTLSNYAKKLQKILNTMDSSYADRVLFHGLLSAEDKKSVLSTCDIAILNPTGKSEAAPSSPLECFKHGIPVIAGADFGMWDIMRHFPKMDLLRQSISNILINIGNGKNQIKDLRAEIFCLAMSDYTSKVEILNQWQLLFRRELCSTNISIPNKIFYKILIRHYFLLPIKFIIKLVFK